MLFSKSESESESESDFVVFAVWNWNEPYFCALDRTAPLRDDMQYPGSGDICAYIRTHTYTCAHIPWVPRVFSTLFLCAWSHRPSTWWHAIPWIRWYMHVLMNTWAYIHVLDVTRKHVYKNSCVRERVCVCVRAWISYLLCGHIFSVHKKSMRTCISACRSIPQQLTVLSFS